MDKLLAKLNWPKKKTKILNIRNEKGYHHKSYKQQKDNKEIL